MCVRLGGVPPPLPALLPIMGHSRTSSRVARVARAHTILGLRLHRAYTMAFHFYGHYSRVFNMQYLDVHRKSLAQAIRTLYDQHDAHYFESHATPARRARRGEGGHVELGLNVDCERTALDALL